MTDLRTLPEIPDIARVSGVEDCSAEINGIRWRYLRAGTGPVLLLLHGFMGYSFSWRFVMQGLARHYSVYAVDLPNCGFSERNLNLPGTLVGDAEHLLHFLDHFGIQQLDILGTSRGGGLSIALLGLLAERQNLARVRKVVLSAPISPWMRYGLGRIRFLRTKLGRIYAVHLARNYPFILEDFFRKLYANPASIPPDSLNGYRAGLEPPGSFEHLWHIACSWMNDLKRIESVLPSVESVPAMFLWGEYDRAVAYTSMSELHRRWKNSVEYTMRNIGHMPYEEVPEEFNRIVLDFLLRDTPPVPLQNEPQVSVNTAAESRPS